ncbi:MAG TPA: heterodisulfide reductase-related iron-sulfur binding cluster [Terriglobales bacterium]|nr:heterodisulfide reductase-related iron-sulfur binding cluster [Terriglobales bacterium]
MSTTVENPIVKLAAPTDRPTWELYSACVHCGLCLPFCPTYRVLGQEADSPRGRIYQALLVDEGRLAVGETYVTHIDRCLGCRACETACPSGVQYGRIVERARAQIEQEHRRPWLARRLRRWFYLRVLRDLGKLQRLARLLRFYQRSGLERLVRASGLLRLFGMQEVAALAPRIDDSFFFEEFGKIFPAAGERRGRVALLGGCVAGVAFSNLNRATVRVLTQNGIEVHVPGEQGCCGALHAHAGYREEARALARQNLRAFESGGFDAILSNAAGCGATMKEYDDLLAHDPEYSGRARAFVSKTKDVTEYLAAMGLRPVRQPLGKRVTYQDPCHLAHGQRVRSAPRELLKAAGAELVEMPHPDYCCGSAGTYNVVESALASQILEAKMDEVAATGAPILATANVGCMLQLRAGVAQRRLDMEVRHVIELLDEAY